MNRNRSIVILFLIFLLSISSITLIACTNNDIPSDYISRCIIKYIYPKFGGYIVGDKYQSLERGQDGTEVSIVPFEGYVFVRWSDGVTTPTRHETNVQSSMELTPIFAKQIISLSFRANYGGYIIGDKNQNIEYGTDMSEVEAIPYEGYLFSGWSDGVYREIRNEKNVKSAINATANFIRATKVLQYQSGSIPSVYPQSITLEHGNLSSLKFYLPDRDGYIFDGWYLDPDYKTKVTDGNGYYYLGNTIFYDEGSTLYPKWIININQTFKILMVMVEESNAQLPTADHELIDVNYKMPLIERKICELIPNQVLDYLNNWFNGTVKFEVETFYTTTPIGNDSYSSGNSNGKIAYLVEAKDIPEIYPLLSNYRSIITTLNMNDYKYDLHTSSGSAGQKYGCVYMDSFLRMLNSTPIDEFLNLSHVNWNETIDTYLHEFTHTVELSFHGYEFHKVLKYYYNSLSSMEVIKKYLLNEAIVNGVTVGIPYDFWIGNTLIDVNCIPSNIWHGKVVIDGKESQSDKGYVATYVPFGSELTVKAIPNEGWRFVKWSDGLTNPIRHETNIISFLDITAIFEKNNSR